MPVSATQKFPRAPINGPPVALSADVYNALCDAIERSAKWTVTPPLKLQSVASGNYLSLVATANSDVPLKLTSTVSSQGGRYKAHTYSGGAKNNASGNLAATDIGTASASENAMVWNLCEIARGTHHISLSDPAQYIVMATPTGTTDTTSGFPIYEINVPPQPLIPVTLTQTGGSNGTQTAAATWSYTATSLTGDSLGTSLSPAEPRPFGTMTAATVGFGHYSTSGTFVLDFCFEKPGSTHC